MRYIENPFNCWKPLRAVQPLRAEKQSHGLKTERIGQSAAKLLNPFGHGEGSTTRRKPYTQVGGNGGYLFSLKKVSGTFLILEPTEREVFMELWKDLEGYEGYYQISSQGRVKALYREVINKNGQTQHYPEKLLTPETYQMPNSWYQRVTLSRNHKTTRFLVHRLVAQAFLPNPERKEFVNHLDNNGLNNFVDNLEWCTHSENMLHAQKQGRLFESQSKGGKEGGRVHHIRRLERLETLQGSKVGSWNVLMDKPEKRGKKHYVNCLCDCGTAAQVEATRLIRGEATQCSACGQRKRRNR